MKLISLNVAIESLANNFWTVFLIRTKHRLHNVTNEQIYVYWTIYNGIRRPCWTIIQNKNILKTTFKAEISKYELQKGAFFFQNKVFNIF